ncbi:PhoH family protein [Desulfonatronum thioautotrophicum]|uniref:PhoH family protein n=1 Tax=Desulfonatronum thioautotrophicum TaxID=617001 RepID=UPI0005EBC82B|nr:PhoH family protein [Desulfonatronum thioautotrophicum]
MDQESTEPRPKNYFIDTNVLLDDPESILVLRNGMENNIFLPHTVLEELDKHKTDSRLGHQAQQALSYLLEHKDEFDLLHRNREGEGLSCLADNRILDEILSAAVDTPILVTNDKTMRIKAHKLGMLSEPYFRANPFYQNESQKYTGFIADGEDIVVNSFSWESGKPVFNGPDERRMISHQHKVWNVAPRNVYQNLAMELLLSPDIDLVTLESEAGFGKTFLSLAAALHLVLSEKRHHKIYIVKPYVEVGRSMGYLPGAVSEKMAPYVRNIRDLILKLHTIRPANKLFIDPEVPVPEFDIKRLEILPLAFIRGMNIEDAVVIVDEAQNMSRLEARALLSRMCGNTKVFMMGDSRQVDAPYNTEFNNALNWTVRKLKGMDRYAHLVLKGANSRGPIADMVLASSL